MVGVAGIHWIKKEDVAEKFKLVDVLILLVLQLF